MSDFAREIISIVDQSEGRAGAKAQKYSSISFMVHIEI